jgi:hypothetical protein
MLLRFEKCLSEKNTIDLDKEFFMKFIQQKKAVNRQPFSLEKNNYLVSVITPSSVSFPLVTTTLDITLSK